MTFRKLGALMGWILFYAASAASEAAPPLEAGLVHEGAALADVLERREYEATPNTRGLQAPNRAHELRSYFEPNGLRVHDRSASGSPELLSLTLVGVGRGELAQVAPGEVTHAGARVEIRRPGILEWYLNSQAGLEQGFTLAERPSGEGALVLELAVAQASARLAGDRVELSTATGRQLDYAKLIVQDANGRTFRAHFEVPDPGRLRLVADDAGAIYPLVFDPLLTGSADFTAGSGQDNARAGFSVASAGDVNGDGYADVIIGAYLYDGGNTDEGRAWVYYGSATGLSGGGSPAVLEANQNGAQLGISVASAGDVNGDGYSDVLVGADSYDATPSNEGAVFVFHGSASGIVANGTPANADARLESNQADSQFGTEVAGVGDINGDGYADVAVGAPLYDSGESNEGSVFLFLGSASGIADGDPSNAAAELESDEAGANFGTGLAGAGDVNGDGYADVIAGAPWFRTPDEGGAFVFLGSVSGIASGSALAANSILESNQTLGGGAQFGWGVGGAGDVNGDGYSDVIVGALTYDNGQTDEGAAFVFHGSATGIVASGNPSNANRHLEQNEPSAYFGISATGAGDVNGDGYADVIVGAFFDDELGFDDGLVSIFPGSPTGITNTGVFAGFPGTGENSAQHGVSVAGAGDVNGDGFADLVAGGWLANDGGTDRGLARVFHGGSRGIRDASPGQANTLLERDQASAGFGYGLSAAGDVNGDGYGDLIVGAFNYDNGQNNEGAAFVYHGGANGFSSTPSSTLESNQAGAGLGYSVASAGDVNGDGYGDVVVGASAYDSGQLNEGAAFVFHGGPAGLGASRDPTTANSLLETNQAEAHLGYDVAGANDVNGDGYADVIVGAPDYDDGQIDEGISMVFHGSVTGISPSGSPLNANSVLSSNLAGAALGYSVAGVGDLNADGYADVAAGAVYYTNGQSLEGAVFVFHGGSSGLVANGNPGNANARFETNQAEAAAGSSVAAAGDVNGDGYGDLITGASLYDAPLSQEGAAFVFHGSSSGIPALATPANANTLIRHVQSPAFVGGAVDGAGDVNGDGYADVIVGASNYNAGQAFEGVAFLHHGGPGGVSAAMASRIESDQTPAPAFGTQVAGLGDVNGDGFSDVAVGAYQFDNGQTDEGVALVFYGAGGNPGRRALARQVRALPPTFGIQRGNLAGHASQFQGELVLSRPNGRGRAKLELEVCPTGEAFGDVTCSSWISPVWEDIGPLGALLVVRRPVAGLDPGVHYHWRARTLYAPASVTQPGITAPPKPAHGPWRRFLGMASETDLRMSLDYDGDELADELDPDDDADGLADVDEAIHGTDPFDPDSDDDGLEDGPEVALGTDPLDEDSDGDLVCDGGAQTGSCTAVGPDNCPFVPNFGQANGDPFDAGDACQCGDVTGNGTLTADDYERAREYVVGRTPSGALDPARCDVTGDAVCDVEDLSVLGRIANALPSTVLDSCPAYTTP